MPGGIQRPTSESFTPRGPRYLSPAVLFLLEGCLLSATPQPGPRALTPGHCLPRPVAHLPGFSLQAWRRARTSSYVRKAM